MEAFCQRAIATLASLTQHGRQDLLRALLGGVVVSAESVELRGPAGAVAGRVGGQ
jgi:hypothetical protein